MATDSVEVSELHGKTPISYLQELCSKKGVTPQYDLIANEGAVHEPLFVFRVSAGDHIGNGKGTSKKKAKHNAAVDVLNQMIGISTGSLGGYSSVASEGDSNGGDQFGANSKDAGDGRNPIGELQEMTQKRMWPPPTYEFTDEIGPAHAREFVCTVKLFNVSEQAVGKSKKLAKRNAALVMLSAVRQGNVEPSLRVVESDEYGYDENMQMVSAVEDVGHRTTNGEVSRVRKRISPMFQTSSRKTKLGPVLESLHGLPVEDFKVIDVCKKLEELGIEQSFAVAYNDLPHKSHSGRYQCIVELTTNPSTVCFGTSLASPEEARIQAALSTLRHCQIMTARTIS